MVKRLDIDLEKDFIEWNTAWMLYKGRKYPMFQIKVTGSSEFGQRYKIVDDLKQEHICTIRLTSQNLGDALDFMEANRRARRTFTPVP